MSMVGFKIALVIEIHKGGLIHLQLYNKSSAESSCGVEMGHDLTPAYF